MPLHPENYVSSASGSDVLNLPLEIVQSITGQFNAVMGNGAFPDLLPI